MGRKRKKRPKVPDTIWEVSDALWERLKPLLDEACPPKRVGRPRTNLRNALNGVIFRMRTGCQWNQLPKHFGDDSTVHRWFQRWCADGFFQKAWAVLVAECEELGRVDWEWQAADAAMGKARLGGPKSAPIRQIGRRRGRREASS